MNAAPLGFFTTGLDDAWIDDAPTNGQYDVGETILVNNGAPLLGGEASTGPLAMADVDGDGDLDLFVGGRVVPGRYPEPADSLLLRNDNGRLVIAQRFPKLGLVRGAVFTDFDGDFQSAEIRGGVAELGTEVAIEVTVADMAQGCAAAHGSHVDDAGGEEGHVVKDVLPLEEVEGAAGEKLAEFTLGGVEEFTNVDVG